jgi:hypothetical protein
MKEYQFKLQYRGIPSRGFEGVTDHLTIKLESGDPDRPLAEFIQDLQYGVEELFPNATVTFQGATQ